MRLTIRGSLAQLLAFLFGFLLGISSYYLRLDQSRIQNAVDNFFQYYQD